MNGRSQRLWRPRIVRAGADRPPQEIVLATTCALLASTFEKVPVPVGPTMIGQEVFTQSTHTRKAE